MQVRVLRRLLVGAADGAALLSTVDHLGRSPDQLAAAAGQEEAARWLRARTKLTAASTARPAVYHHVEARLQVDGVDGGKAAATSTATRNAPP